MCRQPGRSQALEIANVPLYTYKERKLEGKQNFIKHASLDSLLRLQRPRTLYE